MKRGSWIAPRSLAALALAMLAAGPLSGCAGYYYGEKYGPTLSLSSNADMVGSSYAAADAQIPQHRARAISTVIFAGTIGALASGSTRQRGPGA